MAISLFQAIGGILTVLAVIALLFIPAVRVFLQEVLNFLRDGFDKFIQTAPKPIIALVFLFLVLFVFNTVISGWLNLNFECTSDDELREIKGGFIGGIGYFLRGAVLDFDDSAFVCTGTPTKECHDFDGAGANETLCEIYGCAHDTPPNICFGTISPCDYFSGNATACAQVGCQNVTINEDLDDFITNNTVPATQYSDDTPENLLTVQCLSTAPRLTLRGFDILSYRNVFILMLIGLMVWLIYHFRNVR